jgi:hypothetical protein
MILNRWILRVCLVVAALSLSALPAVAKKGGAVFKIGGKKDLSKLLNKKDTKANRRTAALEYFRLVPMKQMIEETTQMIAQRLPVGKRKKFVTAMRTKFRVGRLKKAAVKSFVSRFTLSEIKALTAFMKKPEGRSVMKKMKYYTADIMPVLQMELRRSMQAAGLQ